MAFKSKNKDRYTSWRSQNLHRLVKAGIPERIVNNDREFWFLVQEGEELGGGWNVDWISDQEAAELYDILTDFFLDEGDLGWDLLDRLRRRLGHPIC